MGHKRSNRGGRTGAKPHRDVEESTDELAVPKTPESTMEIRKSRVLTYVRDGNEVQLRQLFSNCK